MTNTRYVIRNNYSGAYVHKTLFRIRAFQTKHDALWYMHTHGLNERYYEVRGEKMTIKELEVKRWLNRAFYAEKKVKALEMLLRQCRERAEGLSGFCEGNDKGKSSSCKNGTEDALIKLVDTEHKLQQQIIELAAVSDEICDAISKIGDDDLETVLIHRYVLFHTIEETAEIMNYSVRATQYKHKKAIEKLCTLLHCFAP